MVWFQCEDCGENLKKPKLPNHFRMCSATKLSCIDCGEMFGQQSVLGHTQCITEAEKYGPKGQGKSPHSAQKKPNKPKQNADIDINIGLSSRPPWKCSLCNTTTTSKQTLLLHADGKKHRAKARAFHAAQNQSLDGSTPNMDSEPTNIETNCAQCAETLQVEEIKKDTSVVVTEVETEKVTKKRKKQKEMVEDVSNGEVIQADTAKADSQGSHKKKKYLNAPAKNGQHDAGNSHAEEPSKRKIKWKKIINSTLKSNSDGALKIKTLKKLVLKVIKESGINEDEDQLEGKLMDKIRSSSRFVMDGKCIRLATKLESS